MGLSRVMGVSRLSLSLFQSMHLAVRLVLLFYHKPRQKSTLFRLIFRFFFAGNRTGGVQTCMMDYRFPPKEPCDTVSLGFATVTEEETVSLQLAKPFRQLSLRS